MRHNNFLPHWLAAILVWCIPLPVYAQDLTTRGKPEPITLGVSTKDVLNLPIYLAQKGIVETEGTRRGVPMRSRIFFTLGISVRH